MTFTIEPIMAGPLVLCWLAPHERRGYTRATDPTRPFGVRAGSYLRFGVGGYWGYVAIEIRRPRRA